MTLKLVFDVISVVGVELIVKLLEIVKDNLHGGSRADEVGDSKVVGVLFLSETTSWNGHDSCLIHHLHAVYEVWLLTLRKGRIDELLREVKPWESVHGSFNLSASDLLHLVEAFSQEFCAFSHTAHYKARLLVVEADALI